VLNVVDDDPAPLREWLPVLAGALGARRPLRVPVWPVRLLAGPLPVVRSTAARGASNARAHEALAWDPADRLLARRLRPLPRPGSCVSGADRRRSTSPAAS